MNAPLLAELLLGIDSPQEPELPFASEGVLRYVWQGRFGAMLIEVKDGVAFVNGQRVEPHVAAALPCEVGGCAAGTSRLEARSVTFACQALAGCARNVPYCALEAM